MLLLGLKACKTENLNISTNDCQRLGVQWKAQYIPRTWQGNEGFLLSYVSRENIIQGEMQNYGSLSSEAAENNGCLHRAQHSHGCADWSVKCQLTTGWGRQGFVHLLKNKKKEDTEKPWGSS